jgi:hypothetical protein
LQLHRRNHHDPEKAHLIQIEAKGNRSITIKWNHKRHARASKSNKKGGTTYIINGEDP